MLIVTGSQESGTALWMQILIAAGVPPFGLSPSRDPAALGPDQRAESFEESLRHGIYFGTNPSPRTGQYLFPEQVARSAAVLLPAGVTRTDLAFIGKVLVTLRPVGEYVAAMRRLHALEDATGNAPRARLDPALEWWAENHALLKDTTLRRYPARFVTHDHLLRDPERCVGEVLRFLGEGNEKAALAAVRPEHRRFERAPDLPLGTPAHAVCDELHDAIDQEQPLTPALVARMDDVHRTLLPRLIAEDERVSAALRGA